jgi:hypothetical protein
VNSSGRESGGKEERSCLIDKVGEGKRGEEKQRMKSSSVQKMQEEVMEHRLGCLV